MRFSCIWKEVIIGGAILAAAALSQSPVFAQADPAPVRQVEVADPALWVVSDEDSTARAKSLSGPRSPSGALVSAENPSIARPPPPSTRPA